MAIRTKKEEWQKLLARYAEAWQESGIAAKAWYNNEVADGKWDSAKRHITCKGAKAYLEESAKNRKKSTSRTAKNRTRKTATNRNAQPVSDQPENKEDSKKTSQRQKLDRGDTVDSKNTQAQPGAKQSVVGGARPGAGAPVGNRNAVKHGLYSRFMEEEESELYSEVLGQTQILEQELAYARVRLARATAMDADLRKLDRLIAEGASEDKIKGVLNHSPLELDTWEFFDGEEGSPLNGEKWVKKRPDMEGVIDRLLGRISNLESLIFRMSEGLPLKRNEQIVYQGSVLDRLTNGEITPVQAGRALESQGLKVPTSLALEIRNELANPVIDDEGGITEEELDKIVEEGRQHREGQQAFLAERREWIEERFSEDG